MPLSSLRWFVAALAVLQCVDFLLTWALLSGTFRTDVIEANPLARGILDSCGWPGLALFKAGVTLIVLVAVLGVAQKRPALGGKLGVLMCLLMLGVNGYSGWLLASPPSPALHDLAAETDKANMLAGVPGRIARFDAARATICDKWREQRLSLTEAMGQMARLIEDYRPTQPAYLQRDLPNTERPEQLASYLYFHASRGQADMVKVKERLERELAEEFTETIADQVEQHANPRNG